MEVSVVIPVFNGVDVVEHAVRSALDLAEVHEVIIADDGSTDGTADHCRVRFGTEPRVNVIGHADGKNRGVSVARNLGYQHSRCPFIVFLDADDRLLPGRFVVDAQVFERYPDADGVYGATRAEFADGTAQERFLEQWPNDAVTTVHRNVPPEELFDTLLGITRGAGYFHLDALTVRRSALEQVPGPFHPLLRLHQDTCFVLQLAFACRLYPGSIDVPIAVRWVHARNRITASNDLSASRSLLYAELLSWARAQRIVGERLDVLRVRSLYWAGKAGLRTRWSLLSAVLSHIGMLRYVRFREHLLAELFGDGRVARTLGSWMWRLGRNDHLAM
ncbi:MAG: glycosyltransferase family 2 protein [Flavobacteriales bacterium]|nr:glycosyltransferase family 2 protein [Flavobacteriales bacterium]